MLCPIVARVFVLALSLAVAACGGTQTVADSPAPSAPLGPYGHKVADALATSPDAVAFLRGMFDRMLLSVNGSAEQMTLVFDGDALSVQGGEQGPVDLAVALTPVNFDTLLADIATKPFDSTVAAHVVAPIMLPSIAALMSARINKNPVVIALADVGESMCTELVDGKGQIVAMLRTEFVKDHWNLASDCAAPTVWHIRIDAAAGQEYQRRMHTAMALNSMVGWNALNGWFLPWRKAHVVPPVAK